MNKIDIRTTHKTEYYGYDFPKQDVNRVYAFLNMKNELSDAKKNQLA